MSTRHDPKSDDRTPYRYTAEMANAIEPRWQAWWDEHGTSVVPNPGQPGFDPARPKFYCLDMFPYPSGAGLHVGHPEGYTATDILSRYKRMTGCNVLHPMGFDAFGLPAEQHAINTGQHPASFTRGTIDTFRTQLKRFGFCYDWSRELATIDEDYYKWTQWIFVQIYNAWFDPDQNKARPISALVGEFESGSRPVRFNPEASEIDADDKARSFNAWDEIAEPMRHRIIDSYRLAYVAEQTVNWCPKLGTALANEEVVNGRSERGHHPVARLPLRQWLLRITAYAERLLDGLADLHWPESTKAQQMEWIGRSEGAEVDFNIVDPPATVGPTMKVYTTRPDTLFGATYMVVAPEHPLVDAVLGDPRPETPADALGQYVQEARNRSDVQRQENKEKTGVFTGLYATNPVNNERIPIWTADYVLMGYGHGAIMAVPAHDQRDYDFAKAFDLPIRDVVYTRIHAVMAHYASHAVEEEASTDAWHDVLADAMGLATTSNAAPDTFDALLDAVRTRRKEANVIEQQQIADAMTRGYTGRRGTIRDEYLAALDELGIDSFDTLRDWFASASFYAKTGSAMPLPEYAANSAGDGISLDGLPTVEAKAIITRWLADKGLGKSKINYRLRDWLFSRQRYWGEPFPIVYDEHGRRHVVTMLPVTLPDLDDYHPEESDEPMPLLAKATDWVHTTAGEAGVADLPPDAPVTRETNTMPGWAGSCWYHLRYCDPKNADALIGKEADAYWMGGVGVDQYVGGAEHAVLHLLYARFWHMVLHDLGHVASAEPYRKLYHQGLITSFAYQRPNKTLVPIDEVEEVEGGRFVERATGAPVEQVVAKMSKSLKNVVNPDEIIAEFGADTFRLYEMYMGPLDATKPWNTRDTVGLFRFIQKLWRLAVDVRTGALRLADAPDEAVERRLHRMIAKVGPDIEKLAFNTAIAAMIEFVNAASSAGESGVGALTRSQLDRFVRALSPFTPHVAEELWDKLHGRSRGSVAHADWPGYDEAMLSDDTVEIPVQIMGKVRSKVVVPAGADNATMEKAALADERIAGLLAGKTVRKVIVVPGRLVNIVAG